MVLQILHPIDDCHKMPNRLGSFLHDDEYLTIKNLALIDCFFT